MVLARFSRENGLLYFERPAEERKLVESIQTAGKKYYVSPAFVEAAKAEGVPLLEVTKVSLESGGDIVTMEGRVYKHPTRPDRSAVRTPPVTTLNLEGGESFETKFGCENKGSSIGQMLVAAANGRQPQPS